MEKELITKVQNERDSGAFRQLLKENERIIYSIIGSFHDFGSDYLLNRDDLYQEASIALFDACMTYDPEAGARFSSYAYVVIRRRVSRAVKTMMRSYREETMSFDKFEDIDRMKEFSTSYVRDDPVRYSENRERQDRIAAFLERLEEGDRMIVEARLSGLSYREIAEKLGLSTKKVDNRLMRIKKMRERYL